MTNMDPGWKSGVVVRYHRMFLRKFYEKLKWDTNTTFFNRILRDVMHEELADACNSPCIEYVLVEELMTSYEELQSCF